LEIKLYPHQLEAIEFLRKRNYSGYIMLPTGTGKTLIACYALKEYMDRKKFQGQKLKALILAPKSAIPSWEREITRLGIDKEKVTVMNYEALLTKVKSGNGHILRDTDFLILDEAHRVKNIRAKTTRMLMKCGYFKIPKILLSGTPFKDAIDLYTQFFILDPGIFGRWKDFVDTYFEKEPNPFGSVNYKLREGSWEKILEKIEPFVFKKERETLGKDLNKKRLVFAIKVLTPEKYSWENFKKSVIEDILKEHQGSDLDEEEFLNLMIEKIKGKFMTYYRLAQIENQEKHSKIAKFVEKYPKSVIYTNFVEEAQKLKELLSAYLITGETSKKEREEILSKQDRPLVITSALSEGADLNQYQCLILATIPSSIIKFKQVVGRINRISQKGNKLIYVLVLDEYNQKMLKLLKERKKLDEMLKRAIRNYLIRNQNFRNATPKMRNENKYSLKEPV